MDPQKVEAILIWPTPKPLGEVINFYGLASFYHSFINNFSHTMAPMIDTIKGEKRRKFQWTKEADQSFEYLKTRSAHQPILTLHNFNKVFAIECDAIGYAIGVVLSQEGKLIAF